MNKEKNNIYKNINISINYKLVKKGLKNHTGLTIRAKLATEERMYT